jgi:hypothetical protein
MHHGSTNAHGDASTSWSHDSREQVSQDPPRAHSQTKKVIKTFKILILQSTKTMKMKMMVQFKQEQQCLTQEFITPSNEIIPLIAFWETHNEG